MNPKKFVGPKIAVNVYYYTVEINMEAGVYREREDIIRQKLSMLKKLIHFMSWYVEL